MPKEIEETFSTYLIRAEAALKTSGFLGRRDAVIFGSDIPIPLLRDGDDDSITKETIA